MSMTERETYMLCHSTDTSKLNSSGCWKCVILSNLHHDKGVRGTDIFHRVEVANTGTCRPGGATMSHMFHQTSTCSYSEKMEVGGESIFTFFIVKVNMCGCQQHSF